MIEFEAGDRVKVIGQDIVGTVLRVHYDTNEVVIQDDYSEYEAPDDELVYRAEEVKLLDSEGEDTLSLNSMSRISSKDTVSSPSLSNNCTSSCL